MAIRCAARDAVTGKDKYEQSVSREYQETHGGGTRCEPAWNEHVFSWSDLGARHPVSAPVQVILTEGLMIL